MDEENGWVEEQEEKADAKQPAGNTLASPCLGPEGRDLPTRGPRSDTCISQQNTHPDHAADSKAIWCGAGPYRGELEL